MKVVKNSDKEVRIQFEHGYIIVKINGDADTVQTSQPWIRLIKTGESFIPSIVINGVDMSIYHLNKEVV